MRSDPVLSLSLDLLRPTDWRPPRETKGEEEGNGFIWQTFYNDCQRRAPRLTLLSWTLSGESERHGCLHDNDRKGHLARSNLSSVVTRDGHNFSHRLEGSAEL